VKETGKREGKHSDGRRHNVEGNKRKRYRRRERENKRERDKKRETGQVRTGHSRSLRLTGNEGSNQGQFLPHIELSLFCLHCDDNTHTDGERQDTYTYGEMETERKTDRWGERHTHTHSQAGRQRERMTARQMDNYITNKQTIT
jgi:hypothetical protein